ncbi:hypothetical protein EU527_07070 [Candidatus Thorarchaeota archaeon]|nr:MAG: hypothetical protein EU527_07070 [Candidatus Thorarchaeota archaeon]
MKSSTKIILIAAFAILLLIPIVNNDLTNSQQYIKTDSAFAGDQDEASWWNSTFIYRRYFNFTEPNVSDRTNTPVHLYLTFEDQHCYANSIRVMFYNSTGGLHWSEVPFQTWNTSYYADLEFVKSTRVSFSLDVAKNSREGNYYIYYAKEDVGSVSYPDYYPFIYRSYTFSLIDLVSYYDGNNYEIVMYDDPLQSGDGTWKNPNDVHDDVDRRWKNSQVTPDSTPYGTLNKYQNARYEPTSSSYDDFWGYYTVYANYPMAVSMGQGDKGSNPAVNDWWPGVNELGHGVGTKFIIGGVEGFESKNEGKYWIQSQEDGTQVYVWTTSEVLDTGWSFYNGTSVVSWPAVLKAGEYIAKRDVLYTTYYMINSTKPVSVRAGDSDSSYARDIGGYFPTINGGLVGEEFYTIDMGNSNDKTRITNIGNSPVTVEWWRNSGSGWVKGSNLVDIPVNGSATIPAGTASISNPEDILRILGPAGSRLYVEGVYNTPSVSDYGDWAPTMTGDRFGLDYRIWAGREQKIMIMAWEDVSVDISSYSGSSTLMLSAGDIGIFMPSSSSQTLIDLHANATISIVTASKFYTTSPYKPNGDQGYGWMVPSYYPEGDQAGFIIEASGEIKLFEFDIIVRDLDSLPVEGAFVELRNTDDSPWQDDNGIGRSGITNSNGLIIFEGLSNQTFRIYTEIDAASWLQTSYANLWVTDTTDHSVDGSVTYIDITLNIAGIDIYYEDLMGNPLADNPNEDTTVRLDITGDPDNNYIAQAQTDATGTAHFHRVPQDDYQVYARYAGSLGWSYSYSDISNFADWSIDASEFEMGSFSHNWEMPLITLKLHIESWDMLDVSGATINIDKMGAYAIQKTSNVLGEYTFYRILNGTWDIDVWKADDYANTPLARNNTVQLSDLQDYTQETIKLPLSRLVIRVQTGPTTYVEGAAVNVTMRSVGLVAQGTTNSTGHVSFLNIHANMSTPYAVSYNLTVVSGDKQNGTLSELLVKCDSDYWYINRIFIATPTYLPGYTELNSTAYFINARWGRNATFTVGWYERTDVSTSAFAFDSTSWLSFTIYYDSIEIGTGTWTQAASSPFIEDPTGINFVITIDTDFWDLAISTTAYQIVIKADTSGKLAPAPITIYLTVLAAQTSQGIGTSDIIEYYGTHDTHDYWMNDLTNGGYVHDLDVYTFAVKIGTIVQKSGNLIDNLDGTYSLPATALSGFGIGTYVITIMLEKANYINQTILVGATINELPMIIEITSINDYIWTTSTVSIQFEYQIGWNLTATELNGLSVNIEWINTDTGISYLNVSRVLSAPGGTYVYNFVGNILPVGNWTIKIACKYVNYGQALISYSTVKVTEALTTLTIVGSDTLIVDWTQPATFTFDYQRGATGLVGATVETDWERSVVVSYLGNGRYSLTFDTTVPATSYLVSITFSLANHESQGDSITIEILIPLLISTEYGSEETPLVAYWTRSFDVIVTLYDISREDTTISLATIEYWDYPNPMDTDYLVELSPGVYGVTLDGQDANPLNNEYQIRITADYGLSTTETIVFLFLQDVPNEIVLEYGGFVPYFGDVVTINFYWNNTLDNEPIILPSSASFTVEPLMVGIGGFTNYGNGTYSFDVDTKSLEMFVDPYNGFYRIRIAMQADGFEPIQDVFVFFLMRESPTHMDYTGATEVIWSNDLLLRVNLWDSRHSELIWSGAVVEILYGTNLITMESFGNGTFWKEFDSSIYFEAIDPADDPYRLAIRYHIPNYVDGQIDIEIRVNAVEGEIAMITGHLQDGVWNDGTWTESVEIQIWAFYAGEVTHLPEGVAEYFWIDYPTIRGTFSYSSLIYTAQIDTSAVFAGTRTLRIIITLQNHTIIPYDLIMEINPLEADFESEVSSLEAIYGSTETIAVAFTLSYDDSPLLGAEVSLEWNSVIFRHTMIAGEYVVLVRPSQISGLTAPMIYYLNFTMSINNYTAAPVQIPLYLLAPSTITVENRISVEYGERITIIFQYLNTMTGNPIQDATVTASIIRDGSAIPLTVEIYNSTHYRVLINAADVGDISGEPYILRFEATAEGYQSWLGAETGFNVDFYVREPTYNIPFLGRLPKSDVHNTLLLFLLFGIIVGSVIGVRRLRIPYQIKQIDRAIKQMEKGKVARVQKIKTMGMVISELLAPGLAELDIEAPVIESGPEGTYEDYLDDDTEDLLGELDALDDVVTDEDVAVEEGDFEAELEAELEAITEEEPEIESETETTEVEAVEDVEKDEPQEEQIESESDVPEETELEFDQLDESKDEVEVTLPEILEVEPVEEPEIELSEFEETDAIQDDFSEDDALNEVVIEDEEEIDDATSETTLVDEVDLESEEATEESLPADISRLSKNEMIELLPPEVKDRYPPEELRKLTKKELQELLDYMTEIEEE